MWLRGVEGACKQPYEGRFIAPLAQIWATTLLVYKAFATMCRQDNDCTPRNFIQITKKRKCLTRSEALLVFPTFQTKNRK